MSSRDDPGSPLTDPARDPRGESGAPRSGVWLVATAAALWGTDALFRRGLALELPAPTIVFSEHLILVIATAPLLWRSRGALRAFSPADWLSAVMIGAGASATATVLFTAAFRYGDPNAVLLLQKLQPVIAIVAAVLLLGERLRPRFGLYFVAAVAGGWLIAFDDPLAVSASSALAAALALGAATLWAFGTVLGRRLTPRIDPPGLTAVRFAIGLPVSALLVLGFEGTAGLAVPTDALPALVGLALVPGLLALWLYYRGLRRTPASVATIAELAFPLSAIVINRLAFGDVPTSSQWVGIAVLSATLVVMAAQPGHRALGVRVPAPPEPRRRADAAAAPVP